MSLYLTVVLVNDSILPAGLRREMYRWPSVTKPLAQFKPTLRLYSLRAWALLLPQKDIMRISAPRNPVCHTVSHFSTCAPVLGFTGQMERALTFQAFTVCIPDPFPSRDSFPKEVPRR